MKAKERICLDCHRELVYRDRGIGRKLRCYECMKIWRVAYKKEADIIVQATGLGFGSSFVALNKMSLDHIG